MNKHSRRSGQALVDYILIITMLAILVLAIMIWLSPKFKNMIEESIKEENVGQGQTTISTMMY